jgi:hypothetical protein
MANEEKLGWFDLLIKRIEGETVNNEPAFALATFNAGDVADNAGAFCLVASGSYNYSIQTDKQITPQWAKGAYFILDIGGFPASGSLVWTLDVPNPCNNEYSAFAQGSYLQASGMAAALAYRYLVYPGAVDTDSLLTHLTQLPLPHEWRCRVNTGGGSGTWAFSVGVQYID